MCKVYFFSPPGGDFGLLHGFLPTMKTHSASCMTAAAAAAGSSPGSPVVDAHWLAGLVVQRLLYKCKRVLCSLFAQKCPFVLTVNQFQFFRSVLPSWFVFLFFFSIKFFT